MSHSELPALIKLKKGAIKLRNYFPEIPKSKDDQSAIVAYRSLGIMALLDIDGCRSESEKSIDEYYSARLAHLQTRTALIATSSERKPVAYALWDIDESDKNLICLKRQNAPFGDHLELQKKLKAALPVNVKVLSYHSHSARQKQVAW